MYPRSKMQTLGQICCQLQPKTLQPWWLYVPYKWEHFVKDASGWAAENEIILEAPYLKDINEESRRYECQTKGKATGPKGREGAQGHLEQLQKWFNELGEPLRPKLGVFCVFSSCVESLSSKVEGFNESSGHPEVLKSHLAKSFSFRVLSHAFMVICRLKRRHQEQSRRFEAGEVCRRRLLREETRLEAQFKGRKNAGDSGMMMGEGTKGD
ncbi:hypothetical protein K438DRAFT_1781866 [Mycena galopus ATCC 62051]|nr:hypothetical protein K438DRAFT_1781866 [Mycena galopus ATCC 62051]